MFFQEGGQPIETFGRLGHRRVSGPIKQGYLFPDLRLSALRNMRLAGLHENVAMEISDHRTRSVFDRYNIVSGRDLADAASKMEQRHTEARAE